MRKKLIILLFAICLIFPIVFNMAYGTTTSNLAYGYRLDTNTVNQTDIQATYPGAVIRYGTQSIFTTPAFINGGFNFTSQTNDNSVYNNYSSTNTAYTFIIDLKPTTCITDNSSDISYWYASITGGTVQLHEHNNQLFFSTRLATDWSDYIITIPGNCANFTGKWNELGITTSPSTTTMYLNGYSIGSHAYVTPTGSRDAGVYHCFGSGTGGGAVCGSGSSYVGTMDEILYYTDTKNNTEMLTIYTQHLAGYSYPFTPTYTNFTIYAYNKINSSQLYNFTAIINGTTYNSDTVAGTITTGYLSGYDILNITVNATGYLGNLTLNYNTTTNLNVYLEPTTYKVNITAKDNIFNNSICTFNATINGIVYNSNVAQCILNSTINVSTNGDYIFNVTTTAQDYNSNLSLNLDLTTGKIIRLVPIYNAKLNITAKSGTTQIAIFNTTIIDINLLTNNTYGTTTNITQLNLTIGNNYTVFVDAPGYAYPDTLNFTPTSNFNTLQVNLTATNSINISIYDESTGLLITNVTTNQTTNVTLIGSYSTTTYTTNTGNLFVSNLTTDTYNVQVDAPLYSQRTYTITVSNRSTQTLNVYLTQSSTAVLFTYQEKATGNIIEGMSVSVTKLINGTWTLVETKYTDVTGRVQFTLSTNTYYRFTATKDGYITKTFDLNPVIFTSYTVQVEKSTSVIEPLDFQDMSVTYTSSFYNDRNNNFTWTIQSPNGYLQNYGYSLTTQCKNITSFTGVNAYGQTSTANFNLSCATIYDSVTLIFYYTDINDTQKTFTYSFGIHGGLPNNTTISTTLKSDTYGMGLFERILIATVIALILIGVISRIGGIVSGLAVGLIVLGYFVSVGFIPLSVVIITLFVGFVLMLMWGNR